MFHKVPIIKSKIELLPEPLRPTIAVVSPVFQEKFKSLRANFDFSEY